MMRRREFITGGAAWALAADTTHAQQAGGKPPTLGRNEDKAAPYLPRWRRRRLMPVACIPMTGRWLRLAGIAL
jgi:hypothetical protein